MIQCFTTVTRRCLVSTRNSQPHTHTHTNSDKRSFSSVPGGVWRGCYFSSDCEISLVEGAALYIFFFIARCSHRRTCTVQSPPRNEMLWDTKGTFTVSRLHIPPFSSHARRVLNDAADCVRAGLFGGLICFPARLRHDQ